ncbi:recombinase family protein [Nocardioides sp.]|uniref:recombinase family protein n=1 Tax=Nocardioides sp. TaxID=35761 RepID=UPI0035673D8E
MHVIGYTRVSTEEQARSGLGLEAQRQRIEEEATRRGWTVEWLADEGCSGKQINPGLREALDRLRTKQADALVVAKMDRLARSVLHAADIATLAKQQGWSLVLLDLDLDTSTPQGRAMYNMLATFAEFERELISQRTKDALARAKANGKRLGRRSVIPKEVLRRIISERNEDASFAGIAKRLGEDGIPSPTGRATWSESVVRRAFQAATA